MTRLPFLAGFFVLSIAISNSVGAADFVWTRIDSGLYYADVVGIPNSTVGDSHIDILRIDPKLYRVEVKMISEDKGHSLTASEWSKQCELLAVINAGMFQTDQSTHVGYLKHGGHVNNAKNTTKYLSVAAFDPIDTTLPPFRIFDLDTMSLDYVKINYRTVIQNLRLIKRPGINVWSRQDKMWSEAALGEDKNGNILFIFSRSPYSMYDLNHILLKLPIDLVAAQHLEGGPEASLYISHNGQRIERMGSYETAFLPSDSNDRFWPLPSVIGIVKKSD